MTHPGVRVSDEERRQVVTDLERHAGEGRLTLAEFTERAGQAWAAATRGELAAVVSDLPALPPAEPEPVGVHRHLFVALAGAVLVVAVLGVLLALFRP